MSEEKLIGYCFKCKEKREIVDPKAEWAANGSPGTRGTCPVCGGTIYKTGYTPAHENLPKPKITRSSKKKKKEVQRRGRLVIVESPAKAKTIGRYLGRGYTVKSSVGHVRDLLKSRLSVDVDDGYAPEYRVPNDKRQVVKDLKEAAAKAKEIYLATDPDREGEAIAWHVLESAEMEPERTQRVVFMKLPNRPLKPPSLSRATLIWSGSTRSRLAVFWTGWWVTSSARCSGARCAAGCRPVECSRWPCA
jgi:DNA topoisomerase I